ncbi:MAG: hypothetical protein ACC608_10375 [Anaerofustis sp.]
MSRYQFEERLYSMKQALIGNGFDVTVFEKTNSIWKPSERETYQVGSWSGYLEKCIEKGAGNHVKVPALEGKNALGLMNPYSRKESVFNCSNWNDIKTSSFFKEYIPPAFLITNDRQLLAHQRQFTETYQNLQGTIIICKRDKRENLDAWIYSVGQNKTPTKRISFRELFDTEVMENLTLREPLTE